MLVYSYRRFSCDRQTIGDSFRRQEEQTQKYCQRRGWKLDDSLTISDPAVSAFRGKNAEVGELGTFLRAIQAGLVPVGSAFIVESLDRLSRSDVMTAVALFSSIIGAGVTVITLTPEREYSSETIKRSPFEIMEIALIFIRANEESATKSQRVKQSWQKRRTVASPTKLVTTVCPRWLSQREGKWVVDRAKAETVNRIYRLYVDGMGAQTIARTLNTDRTPVLTTNKTAKGRVWDQEAIRHILQSRATLGEYQPQEILDVKDGKKTKRKRIDVGQPILDYYPAIVEKELWLRASGAMNARGNLKGRTEHNGINVFKGLLFDAKSKSTMTIKSMKSSTGHKFRYLVPSRSVKDGTNWVSMSYVLAELGLITLLRELVITPTKDDSQAAKIEAEEAIIKRLQASLDRLNAEEDIESLITLTRKLTESKRLAESRLLTLKEAQQQKPTDDMEEMRTMAQQWERAESEGKLDDFREVIRNKLRTVVESIWVLIVPHTKIRKTTYMQFMLKAGGSRWIVIENGKDGYIGSALDTDIKDGLGELRHYKG